MRAYWMPGSVLGFHSHIKTHLTCQDPPVLQQWQMSNAVALTPAPVFFAQRHGLSPFLFIPQKAVTLPVARESLILIWLAGTQVFPHIRRGLTLPHTPHPL